jgi:flavin-dependent dehydrogenase
MLPRLMGVIDELGLEPEIRKLPHVPKVGAEFALGNDSKMLQFFFADALIPTRPVFSVERSLFDQMLTEQARLAGAEVFENTPVRRIVKLEEGAVEIATDDRTIRGRMLLDASGYGTVVGRHLKQRLSYDDPQMQKVAYFSHFENVETSTPDRHPTIFMCQEGWFWLIAVNDTKMSIGFVTDPGFAKRVNVPANRLLQWAMVRCPQVRERMKRATGPGTNEVIADFSYTCKPFSGPGYFLIGDAACFLDPIFSTGVTLAMYGGVEAAKHTAAILSGKKSPAAARTQYNKLVTDSTAPFWKIIRNYYKPSFRDFLLEGQGPVQVHKAIFAVLAGHVFPRPRWKLRWRLQFFWLCMAIQKYVRIVPRRPQFSLLAEPPGEIPAFSLAPQMG